MSATREPFLWGAAMSGYQSEGGYNGPGQPHNNWAEAEASGRVAKTGSSADFWHRYAEDYTHAKSIGLNALRLSVEWSRIQPSFGPGRSEVPDFDVAALDAYAERLAACQKTGLEPVLTLHHFTHPAWLGPDAWLDDETPALFEKFVATTVRHINRAIVERFDGTPLKWYVTINEPNMLVLNTYLNRAFPGGGSSGLRVGIRAYNRLLGAHVLAYNAIHDLYEAEGWPTPQVTMNTFCSDVYWSEQLLIDLLCMRENGVTPSRFVGYAMERAESLERELVHANLTFRNDPFVSLGRLVYHMANFFARRAASGESFRFLMDILERSPRVCVLDFLGIDYYDPFCGHTFRPPSFADLEFPSGSLHARLVDSLSSKWWDWHVLPQGMHFFCEHYSKAFGGKGVLIAENGMALRRKADGSPGQPRRDRVRRSEFLEAHVQEVRRLRRQGVPMLGYLHWSLADNYEWGSFTPRFGLYTVNYADGARREVQDHLGDRPSETYARLLREERGSG